IVFPATSTTDISTLSLHDALPISPKLNFSDFVVLPDFDSFFRCFVKLIARLHIERFVERILIYQRPERAEVARRVRICLHLIHRSEEHTSELQSRENLVCRLLLEK